ncbi:Hypothetical_protein [Hexamita inflata]|uniref:Hypothetical_protein n=1 Tax=Hexamita inflata TaxID=28002 RepID=A0AA86N6N0_9EUKA|nr:Hypothetical protein HINF_LOCUS1453 [Hexamita inflata]
MKYQTIDKLIENQPLLKHLSSSISLPSISSGRLFSQDKLSYRSESPLKSYRVDLNDIRQKILLQKRSVEKYSKRVDVLYEQTEIIKRNMISLRTNQKIITTTLHWM